MSGQPRRRNTLPTVRANTVRFPEEVWRALRAESDRTGRSMGELVRTAVTLYLAFVAALQDADDDDDLRARLLERLR
jgi:predicted DNA-binding protein